MISTIIISAGIVILVQIVKRFITPKFGATGLHIFIFLLALAIVCVKAAMTYYPGFGAMVVLAGEYLAGALTLYQVIWKQLEDKLTQ